jgi:hypothetical protein
MTIKEILALEDKYPVPVVDRCLIKKIGEAGDSQLITLEDGKNILRVSLRDKNHILDPDEDLGKYLKIMSGKPVKNKPTGIIFRIINEKPKLIVTGEATLSLTTDADERKPQLTETSESDSAEDVPLYEEGPSDEFITNNIFARVHLNSLLERIEMEDPLKLAFITDRQAFITSLYMDCINTGHKILPVPQKEGKKKFDKYDKPKVEKPAPKAETPPEGVYTIEDAVRSSKIMRQLKEAKSKQGVACYDLLLDPQLRAKTYRWYWMNREEDCGALEPLRDTLKNFYSLASTVMKRELCAEAIRMDVSMLCKVGFGDEDAINGCLVEIMKTMKAKEIGSSFAVEFFAKPKELRTIDYPVS